VSKSDFEFDESEGSKIYEAANKYVFEDNGHKWSNNNNECGDNFGSFLEGARYQHSIDLAKHDSIVSEMNKNCISIFLHEQRMKISEKEIVTLKEELEEWKRKFRIIAVEHPEKMQRERDLLKEVNKELVKAIDHTSEFCVCKRNTFGFDYHEDHPTMGKPKSGSRWLTPKDFIKETLARVKEKMNG
jgi:hypothetical protein